MRKWCIKYVCMKVTTYFHTIYVSPVSRIPIFSEKHIYMRQKFVVSKH